MNLYGEIEMPRKTIFMLAIFTFFGVAAYLLVSAWVYRIGFPLDDSWIHLTYARNLSLRGEWSFIPGQNSAGSTSPLWTGLLAIGYFLKLGPYLWPFFLGGLILFLLAWRVEYILRKMQPAYKPSVPWAGLVILSEWHLAWAAVSGMEILLHALLIMVVLSMLFLNSQRFLLIGILTGLSIWSRPDGLTLLGPLVLFALLQPATFQQKASALGRIVLGFAALFVPYLLFNLLLSGTPWPNTFYAKQVEYADWQVQPAYNKLLALLPQYFSGATLLLLPAVVLLVLKAVQKRGWGVLLSFTWLLGYIWIYVSRLPVYQHARYLMPTIPVFLVLGLIFLIFWLPIVRTRIQRNVRFAWLFSLGAFSFLFWVWGAQIYAQNVAWIESEMVETAQWVARNLPPETLVAAHDIGALGYFGNRSQIVDLAGLISPEIVPFMRDEAQIFSYIQNLNATHVIVFPLWYPGLIKECLLVYQADGRYAGLNPLGILSVYECPKP